MKSFLYSHYVYIAGALLLIGIAVVSLASTLRTKNEEHIIAQVSRGDILEIVSVSGVVESNTTAKLSFPTTDIVASVNVRVGDTVNAGDTLATLRQADLLAERQNAIATLQITQANLDELIAGPRNEARDITRDTVANAESNLSRVTVEQDEKVANTLRALRSNDLEAIPLRSDNNDTPPIVSGAYICDTEGSYSLDVYKSDTNSGYTYRLDGLESGRLTAFTESPGLMGTCGLSIQFVTGSSYGNSDWIIDIPNKRSTTYITYLNTYELAVVTHDNAIKVAAESLGVALINETYQNASPREEALRRANAEVLRASAGLELINARIEEHTLRAPFAGIITDVDIVVGETVKSIPIITLLGNSTFDLSARIPEIDIARIKTNNQADVVFDARSNEIITAEISFISPLATEIDGVAYFKAQLIFPEAPDWLRAGLNADIDIIVEKKENTLRLPKRFVLEEDGVHSVLVLRNNELEKKIVETGFVGNDGFLEIIGLNEGDTVVAP